jgi:hypothetical protein
LKGPRTYVGAALDEMARKRLRRARRDAAMNELDREMAEIVYIEGRRIELAQSRGERRLEDPAEGSFE